MQPSRLYSIVVPVYKTASSLDVLQERVENVFRGLPDSDYELVFVNDSPFCQSTVHALSEIGDKNKKVTVVELSKNFGQQAATLCGIEYAKGDFIVTMDDDLQHAPEDIPKLIEYNQHDVVIARFRNKKHSRFKKFTSEIKAYFDYKILGKPKALRLSPFRMIKRDVAKWMLSRKTPYPFLPALLFAVTDDFVNVELEHHERFDGKSNYSLLRMVKVFSDLIINNSSFMLRAMGTVGVTTSILSFLLGMVIVFKKLYYGTAVTGWSSLIVAILFIGGMILFTLGIIGEYLIRIIATSEQRPIYYVRKVMRKGDEST